MEFLGVVLDFGVPAISAIGSGLAAYALTGGEEEFPESSDGINLPASTEDDANEEVEELNEPNTQSVFTSGGDLPLEITIDKIEEDLRALHDIALLTSRKVELLGQTQPIWATNILEKLDKISSTMQKIEQRVENGKHSDENESRPSTIDNSTVTLIDEYKATINQAMCGFYHGIRDEVDVLPSQEEWKVRPEYSRKEIDSSVSTACAMLLMFIKNLRRNPEMARYRRIQINNANYRSMLAPSIGYKRVLKSVGFVLNGNVWEWEWLVITADNESKASNNSAESQDPKRSPLDKSQAMMLLDHALSRLQEIKSNEFEFVYEAPRNSSNLAAEVLLNNSPQEVQQSPSISLPTINLSTSRIDAVTKEPTPAIVNSQSEKKPSSSSTAFIEAPTTPPSSSSSSSQAKGSHLETKRTPLSPEVRDVLSKAKAISIFATSRGALGVSPVATTTAATNMFAHDEIARLTNGPKKLSSPEAVHADIADAMNNVDEFSTSGKLLFSEEM